MKQKKLLTTLTALLISIGAPVWMIGWLVPIRESGALLPQVLISIYLRKHTQRHLVWRVGMLTQTLSVFCMLADRGHFIFGGLGGYLDTYFACLPEPGSLCLFSYRERYGG